MQWPNNITFCLFVLVSPHFLPLTPAGETAPFAAAQHIRQAGWPWDHSACQCCCSYLSLPASDSSAAPLAAHRGPWSRCTAPKPVACECVCGAAVWMSAALCNLACRKVSVKVLLFAGPGPPPCRRRSRAPEKTGNTQRGKTCSRECESE